MDLGECSKVHDVALRSDFEREQAKKDHFYDLDALEDLDFFIKETDRKIEIARKKQDDESIEVSEEAKDVVRFV